MPKQVSDTEKKDILKYFRDGYDIKQISNKFGFSSQTITRQLQNIIGKDEFLRIKKLGKDSKKKIKQKSDTSSSSFNENDNVEKSLLNRDTNLNYQKLEESFFEIAPLISNLEFDKQKDISSKPIDKFELPNTVFMIVDNKIELEPKLLKEYSEWEFLPKEDLERKTLEIFSDQRIAKSKCNKNQKLIKIPNSKVFLIASKFLKSRGITRIIFHDNLLSL
mgnify:CR=1 FL=1